MRKTVGHIIDTVGLVTLVEAYSYASYQIADRIFLSDVPPGVMYYDTPAWSYFVFAVSCIAVFIPIAYMYERLMKKLLKRLGMRNSEEDKP